MSWWFVPDVSAWPAVEPEPRGLRAKVWVRDPAGQQWLRKESLRWRPTELAIEAFTLELARRCGLEVATGRCCGWQTDATTTRGFISRKFHDATEEQTAGGELIAPELQLPDDLDASAAEARRRVLTTLPLTRRVLEAQAKRYDVDLVPPFLRMLVFDAWIGNGDRHSANWAILVRGLPHGSSCRLAPLYDTAGCLLAELRDQEVETRFAAGQTEVAIRRYVERCPSGFGDGETLPGIRHRALLEQLRDWPEWRPLASPLISYFSDNLAMVDDILQEIPDDWLSGRRKELVRILLESRVRMLEGLLP